jgi:hypothetical protein
MKKLILLILLISSVYGQNEGFTTIDTLARTVSTATYDTLDLGTGYKSIEIWNQTGGVLNVAFKNTNRDTVNIIQIQNNSIRILNYNKNRYIYLKSSVSGTAKIIAHYGYGAIDYPMPYSTTGEILVTFPQSLIDSLQTDTVVVSNFPDSTSMSRQTVAISDFPFDKTFARIIRGCRDTTSSAGDTVSRRLSTTHESDVFDGDFGAGVGSPIWIIVGISCDDTILVSTNDAFPDYDSYPILPTVAVNEIKFNPDYVANIYYKTYGTGNPTVYIRLWAR